MPWTPADARRHDKDADTAKKKRQWAHIANASKKRGDDDATAIRKASGVVDHVEIPSFLTALNEAKDPQDFDWEMLLGQLAALARRAKLDLERGPYTALLRPKGKEVPRVVISRGGYNGRASVSLEEMGKNPTKKVMPLRLGKDGSLQDRNKLLQHVRNLVAQNKSKFNEDEAHSFLSAVMESTVTDDLNLYEKVQEQLRRGQMVRVQGRRRQARSSSAQRGKKKGSLWSKIKGAARAAGSAAQQAFDAPEQYRR